MEFFIPAAESPEQGEEILAGTRKFAEDQLGWKVSDRRIFQLDYLHEGDVGSAVVGKPEPRTGETVVAILESNAFLVCTCNRGVFRGEPILVGLSEALSIEDFEPVHLS